MTAKHAHHKSQIHNNKLKKWENFHSQSSSNKNNDESNHTLTKKVLILKFIYQTLLIILNNAKDLKTEYKRVEVIKYLGIRIKKNLTLNEHFNVCKKKMEMVIFKVANLVAGCNCPSRMVQLFFVILKSMIDYGSILYTKIKAKTTTEKFARLIRVNFKRALRLKMSTPDKIVYEIIGDPIQEWNRRAKQVDKSKEELEVDMEWKKMQEDRIERRDLRKLMYWEAIYIVSIPIGITRICRKCKGEFK